MAVDWKALCQRLLLEAESTVLKGHASMSDPAVYEAACPFCGSASNLSTKEPHDPDCAGEAVRLLFEEDQARDPRSKLG